MKYWLSLTMIISSTFLVLSQDQAGIKIAIKQEVIEGFEKKFLPLLAEKLGYITIDDKSIDIDAKISTLHIYLSDIHFSVQNLLGENISYELEEPDKVRVNAKDIQGNGHLQTKFKLGFISETDSVDIKVNKVSFTAQATLTTQESSQVSGKIMPSASISDLQLDLDFDFDIHGSVIAFAARLVKSKIKDYIQGELQTKVKDIIKEESKSMIDDLVNQIPVYMPLHESGLALDYSLLSPPKIINGYLVINSNGAIVNVNYPESMNPPYTPPTNLPDYNTDGKQIQMFLSDYSVNTAINSLFLSNMLVITIKSEEIPEESPIKLDTTSLETLVRGISDVYGKGKLVDIETRIIERPSVVITENGLNSTVTCEISLLVRMDDGTSDEALKLSTSVAASGDAHVETDGQIFAQVHSVELSNTKIIESKVPDADVTNIEIVFNFTTKIVLPIVNENFLRKIAVKLPSIEGITIEDSSVDIHDNFIEMNVTPHFSQQEMFTGYWTRRITKLVYLAEEKASLFLGLE